MKIVFVNRYFYPDHSATSQLLADLAFYLSDLGHEVLVVTSRQRIDDSHASLVAHEQYGKLEVVRVWTSRFGRDFLPLRALDYLSFYWSAARVLYRRLSSDDVVVAKTDPPLISVVVACAARRCGARQVNWLHDLFPEVASAVGVRGAQGLIGHRIRRLRDWSLNTASLNVVLGQRMSERLSQLDVESDRVKVIHNWCDGDAIAPTPREDNPLRVEWGLEDKFVVMYSGNMGRAHEFRTLIAAAAGLRDEPRIVFVLIGGGAWRRWLTTEVKDRRLTNVYFFPYQNRACLKDSLTLADVHLISLLPALEGFIVPSKFYGIAAAGKPTVFIGDKEGEIGRILSTEHCGVTVSCGDGLALTQVLRELYHSPQRCTQMGQAARSAYERRFSSQQALARWRDVLVPGPVPDPLPGENNRA